MKTKIGEAKQIIHSIETDEVNSIGAWFKFGELQFHTSEHPSRSFPAIRKIEKAVNEYDTLKKKEGMHDELIQLLKEEKEDCDELLELTGLDNFKENAKIRYEKVCALLKQAEGK